MRQYLAQHVAEVEAARFPLPEPADVARAALVVFDDVDAEIRALRAEVAAAAGRVAVVLADFEAPDADRTHEEPFRSRMAAFLAAADEALAEADEALAEARDVFPATCRFFAFKYQDEKAAVKAFFGACWAPFAADFRDIWGRQVARLVRAQVAAAREALREKQTEKRKEAEVTRVKEGGLKARLMRKKK